MRAIVKNPGLPAVEADIPNTLEALQELVGGYIEFVPIRRNVGAICNEEGRLIGLPPNCIIRGIDFCGTVVVVGTDECDFCDLPEDIRFSNL